MSDSEPVKLEGHVTAKDIETHQLTVGKHMRFRAEFGSITINRGNDVLGIFVSSSKQKRPQGDIAVCVPSNGEPYISLWPFGTAKYPWALSANGLQYVTSDGKPRVIPLATIAQLLDKIE